jgi:RNA polymerase sigma factor (sigma-70 family)
MALLDRDERAWIRAAQAGSVSDLEALFRLHWPRAYRAAYLIVHDHGAAEDIAQDAFLAAVRALERFDRDRPFGPWLHRIVVNRAIDFACAHGAPRGRRVVPTSRPRLARGRREPALPDPDARAPRSLASPRPSIAP